MKYPFPCTLCSKLNVVLLDTYPFGYFDVAGKFPVKGVTPAAAEHPISATKIIATVTASIAFFRSIPPSKANNAILFNYPVSLGQLTYFNLLIAFL